MGEEHFSLDILIQSFLVLHVHSLIRPLVHYFTLNHPRAGLLHIFLHILFLPNGCFGGFRLLGGLWMDNKASFLDYQHFCDFRVVVVMDTKELISFSFWNLKFMDEFPKHR